MNLKIKTMPNVLYIKNLCLYMFFIMTIIIFLYKYNSTMFNIRYGFMVIGSLLGFTDCIRKQSKFYQPFYLIIILFICWTFCFLGQDGYLNYSFSNFMYTVLYIGISICLLNNEYNHNFSLIIYIFTALKILIEILKDTNINNILLANSRNYISVLLLLPLMFYYISCHDKNRKIFVFPAILYFCICVFSVGRGGIISSGFLAIALIIYKTGNIKNKKYRCIMWLLIFIIAIVIMFYAGVFDKNYLYQFLEIAFPRFAQNGTTDVARESIWSSFFKNNLQSIKNFLFGSNVTLIGYEGNLHNSFLQAYASFGLFGFLTVLFLLLKSIVKGFKNKDTLFLILLLWLLIRAFTDRLFFQGYCEIFLYYFILYWDYKNNWIKNQKLSYISHAQDDKADFKMISGGYKV